MNPERWRHISGLFAAALTHPEGDRATFLAKACAGDDSLRREVESLLAMEQGSSGLMPTSAVPPARLSAAPSFDAQTGPSVGDGLPQPRSAGDGGREPRDGGPCVPGQLFGPYRIVRLLGRGGMGEVYEAEHLENGRRLALKLLLQPLTGEVHRARFLREGRLAASITHEHIVYVYGTEEIDGRPAIAMELATGGSLRDCIEAQGPLDPREAVDAILQVAAGLEAAADAGVLHRDVKPSNCFVDADGSIKVGDFGLSIPTAARDDTQLTARGTLLATPAFASPEQLRGEPLDVRSDLYATGATLYYLLTGKPPFAGDGLVELIANVLGRDAESPERLRPEVPIGLAQIVRRCLRKNPGGRPSSYEELRRQLLPFSSRAPVFAPLRTRVMAFFVDLALVGVPFEVLLGPQVPITVADMWSRPRIAANVGMLLYFALLEGTGGAASLGKRLFGLRLVGADHRSPGFGRSLVRAFVFLELSSFLELALVAQGVFPVSSYTVFGGLLLTRRATAEIVASLVLLTTLMILFSTARRANGFAALHDLATRTRVVRSFESSARQPLEMPAGRNHVSIDARRIGPYAVVDAAATAPDDGLIVLGYDEVLRRAVWIRWLPTGSPVVPAERRDMARAGRLRWLNSKRTAAECWDAYEAPEGLPFLTVARHRSPWAAVRFWLLDLTQELESILQGTNQDSLISPERIWITKRGRAMLLDFPAPGVPLAAGIAADALALRPNTDQCQAFLSRFATVALNGGVGSPPELNQSAGMNQRLPLHADAFLKQLRQRLFRDLPSVTLALQDLLGKTTTLTRRRRISHIALSASFPAAAVVAACVSALIQRRLSAGAIVAPLAGSLALVSTFAILSAAYFRGGLMFRALGIALADKNGNEAPRQRVLLRAVVAWSPCVCFILAIGLDSTLLPAAAMLVVIVGVAMAVLTPERGLQDRLAGTWLVPR